MDDYLRRSIRDRFFRASFRVVVGMLAIAATSGCANLNTIERSTLLPGNRKAVHLDIHQRAIISTADRYCAEPSPDGLAAYAAAIGLSVGKPASGTDSLTSSGSSSAAGVGLRTQSITLMRDLMYRICEASANGALGNAHLAVLLGQSQDLATVILAVEQLTGPVAATQVALTAGSQATTIATISASAKQVEILTEQLERANENLQEAKARKATKEQQIAVTQAKKDRKSTALTEAEGEENQEIRDALREEIASLQSELTDLKSELAEIASDVEHHQGIVDHTKTTRDKVLESQDSALASGSTTTSGNETFDSRSSTTRLAADATNKVADTVAAIVTHALDKDYLDEACISIISTSELTETGPVLLASCISLINSKIERQRQNAELDAAVAQRDALIANAESAILQTKGALTKVMNCITDNGTVNSNRVTEILNLRSFGTDLSESLITRDTQDMWNFLTLRADQLQELAKRIDSNPGICLR